MPELNTHPDNCPFCRESEGVAADVFAIAFKDNYPVAEGHTLIIPTRHVARVEELSGHEWTALFDLVKEVAEEISAQEDVDGVNIGVNIGAAAGQTIGHAHVHVIPRGHGDVEDPRGGVRWVIPEKADYWSNR